MTVIEPWRLHGYPSSCWLLSGAPQLPLPPCLCSPDAAGSLSGPPSSHWLLVRAPSSPFPPPQFAAALSKEVTRGLGRRAGMGREERKHRHIPDKAWRLWSGLGMRQGWEQAGQPLLCSPRCTRAPSSTDTAGPQPQTPSPAVTAEGDNQSPFQYLKAFAVMRISLHTTPKPTCKAEFPRGKKNYAQPASRCTHPPSDPSSCFSATSRLTCSSSLSAGLGAPKLKLPQHP